MFSTKNSSQYTRLYSFLFTLLLTAFLAACGGGGGGDDTRSPQAPQNNNLVAATNSVYFEALENTDDAFSTTVRIDLDADIIADANANSRNLYFVITQGNGAYANLRANIFSDYGELVIDTVKASDLPAGDHTMNILVRGCYDNGCVDEFGRTTINFEFSVKGIPTTDRASVDLLSIDQSQIGDDSLSIDFGNIAISDDRWNVRIEYVGGPSDWLQLAKTTEGNTGRVNLDPLDAVCGVYQAKLIIEYSTVRGLASSFEVPVEYEIDTNTPYIESTSPKIHYVGDMIELTATGCGFSKLVPEAIGVQDFSLVSSLVRNKYELELKLEAVSTPGTLPITLSNSPPSPDTSFIEIKPQPKYTYQLLNEVSMGSPYFDEMNDRFFISRGGDWKIFSFDGTTWHESDASFADENRVKYVKASLDGSRLYLVYEQDIVTLDSSSFELLRTTRFDQHMNDGGYKISEPEILNNGTMLVPISQYSGQYNDLAILLDLDTGASGKLGEFDNGLGIAVSVTTDKTSGFFYMNYRHKGGRYLGVNHSYSAVDNKLTKDTFSQVDIYAFDLSNNPDRMLASSYSGHLIESTKAIYNAEFTKLADIPFTLEIEGFGSEFYLNDAELTKDGSRVFVLYANGRVNSRFNDKFIVEFDLSNLEQDQTMPILNQVELPEVHELYSSHIYLTPDEEGAVIRSSFSTAVIPLK